MKWLDEGQFEQKITIEKVDGVTIDNETGEEIPNWVPFLSNIWANVNINSGKEFYASRRENVEWDGLFKAQYRSGITSKMRIKYGKHVDGTDRYFNITSVINPEEANREIHMEAKEVV
jgi:SPP1 family predicted phage head-tail adaptor